jgi:predicted nucleic acid-binding protein
MANGANAETPTFLQQHRAWVAPRGGDAEDDRQVFFTDALIVLDTNVLLDLYRYTSGARNQVLAGLLLVKPRLWLPYMVGSEFIRGRRGVVADRTERLQKAKAQIDRPIREAWRSVQEALDEVKGLLDQFGADEHGQAELDELINEQGFKQLVARWRDKLYECIDQLKNSQDIMLKDVVSGSDPILLEVSALYESRFAAPPDIAQVRKHIEHALSYRYPNKVPPGYLDADKPTPIQAAADYLIWEEMIDHVQAQPAQGRVIFVSGDTKTDWYEPARSANEPPRPWPTLIDEFRLRTGAELKIMETRAFFEGVREFLGAQIASTTVDEIGRTAESRDETSNLKELITADEAGAISPPSDLRLLAYHAARLTSAALKSVLSDPSRQEFQWWLIGVTQELGLRDPEFGEPSVDMVALASGQLPPLPDWVQGSALPRGEFPAPSSTWIAPWMAQVIGVCSKLDRSTLVRLALLQLTHRASPA